MNPTNNLKELTLRGIILGALITIVFTASNVYLGLKVGLTFSSAIPAAMISMGVLRLFQGSNILENNIVQTQASAAGTLSAIIFVLPGLLMMGYWTGFHFWQTFFIAAAGGMLGVMFTIPLRRVMVVNSDLPYPEGVAAAEILNVGYTDTQGGKDTAAKDGLKDIAVGSFWSALVAFCTAGLKILGEGWSKFFVIGGSVFQIPMGFSLALLGAGYLIGIVAGLAMLFGIVLTWGILVPYFTAHEALPVADELGKFAVGIWKSKVRLIGAGVIALAAVWTLITLFKPMVEGIKMSFAAARGSQKNGAQLPETDRDLSGKTILGVVLGTVVLLAATFSSFVAQAPMALSSAWLLVLLVTVLTVLIGFLVAAACGYMAGLVGSSSSPISGIGIIAVIVSSLSLLMMGRATGLLDTPEGTQFATALALFSTSAVVAVAAIANDNLQDLKTGFLVGASPRKQQIALLIGCVIGALVIAPVLDLLYQANGFTDAMPRAGMDVKNALSAPQAGLMTTIATGIFSNNIQWTYFVSGLGLGAALVLVDALLKRRGGKMRLPVLAVGLAIYLPPAVNMPLVIGSILAWFAQRTLKARAAARGENLADLEKRSDRRGVLISSGMIVGESLVGVIVAIIVLASVMNHGSDSPLALGIEFLKPWADVLGLVVFVLTSVWFYFKLTQVRDKS